MLDRTLSPSELTIEAAPNSNVTLRASGGANAVLFTLNDGAPPVTLKGVALASRVVVDGGLLKLSGVTIFQEDATDEEASASVADDGTSGSIGRQLSEPASAGASAGASPSSAAAGPSSGSPASLASLSVSVGRALTMSGGETQLEDVVLQGTRGGALHLIGGVLRMLRCSLLDNEAVDGGALLVSGGEAFVSATHFSRNNATQTGGAICVENGTLVVGNGTLLESNTCAREGGECGASIFSNDTAIVYELPTPLARYVEITDGGTTWTSSERVAIEVDFPTSCSAGFFGNSFERAKQSTPACSGACGKGTYCGSTTITPLQCPAGTYCGEGSPAPSNCPAGTVGRKSGLTSVDDCETCDVGTSCAAGSSEETPCAKGTSGGTAGAGKCDPCPSGSYQDKLGQLICNSCTPGSYCPEGILGVGSAAPTPCPSGHYNGSYAVQSEEDCGMCPRGTYCPTGASEPLKCPAGTEGLNGGLRSIEMCSDCAQFKTGPAGSIACPWCIAGYFADGFDETTSELVCTPCLEPGGQCSIDSNISSVNIEHGWWRLSNNAREVSQCVVRGSTENGTEVTACLGGRDGGEDGEGYCIDGHSGPRCQVCEQPSDGFATRNYFDEDSGVCTSCPELSMSVGVPVALICAACALAALVALCFHRHRAARCVVALRRLYTKAQGLQLVPRFKLLIAFYQIVSAVPDVYGVEMPTFYKDTMDMFHYADFELSKYVLPGQCIKFRERLLLRGFAPLLLLGMMPFGFTLLECGRCFTAMCYGGSKKGFSVKQVFLATLPAVLFVSFCLCPGVSAGIFSAWGCEIFDLDTDANTERSFLREDLSIVCWSAGVQTAEHSELIGLAMLLVMIWPVGMPLAYFLLLFPSRKSILKKRTTHLTRATSFLHREYVPQFYWWELMALMLRLVLVGFVLLIREELWRLLAGTMVALMYLVVIQLVRPYKRNDVNMMAIGTQFCLVCVFMGATFVKVFNDLETTYGLDDAQEFTGFDSSHRIVVAMIAFNLVVLIMIGSLTLYELSHEDSLPTVRRIGTKMVPELEASAAIKWHLFLSHVWSSGQDQMAIVKRQLLLLLPGIQVFLDVDDLEDIDNLESYIKKTKSVLIFLSMGYFFSGNCKKELRATVANANPVILLQEVDMNRGGAPLEQLRSECPDDARSYVFDDHVVIPWLRVKEFQLVSLKMIVGSMLMHQNPVGLLKSASTFKLNMTIKKVGGRNKTNLPLKPTSEAGPSTPATPRPGDDASTLELVIEREDADIPIGMDFKTTDGESVVSDLREGHPADRAGILVGDVLLKFNDVAVVDHDKAFTTVKELAVGAKLKVTVLRLGPSGVRPGLARRETIAASVASDDGGGGGILYMAQLKSTPIGSGMELSADHVVTTVLNDSQASRATIQIGDRLLSINGSPVQAEVDANLALADMPIGSSIALQLQRVGGDLDEGTEGGLTPGRTESLMPRNDSAGSGAESPRGGSDEEASKAGGKAGKGGPAARKRRGKELGSDLFIPGEITEHPLLFVERTTIFVSRYNPGAQALAEEMTAKYTNLVIKAPRRHSSLHQAQDPLRQELGALEHQTTATEAELTSGVERLKQKLNIGKKKNEFFFIYLRSDTWVGEAGVWLQAQVEAARDAGTRIVLAHENDMDKGGCEFGLFFKTTPRELIDADLYGKIAVAMHPGPHRAVSYCLLAKELGARRSTTRQVLAARIKDRAITTAQAAVMSVRGSKPTRSDSVDAWESVRRAGVKTWPNGASARRVPGALHSQPAPSHRAAPCVFAPLRSR